MLPTRFAKLFPDALIPTRVAPPLGRSGAFALCPHGVGPTGGGNDNPGEAARVGQEYGQWMLAPGSRVMVWAGCAVAIPADCIGLITSNPGLAARAGLVVLGGPIVVDEDYRGELGFPLINLGRAPVYFPRDRGVALLAVVSVHTAASTVLDSRGL